jgi:hypothetical protein
MLHACVLGLLVGREEGSVPPKCYSPEDSIFQKEKRKIEKYTFRYGRLPTN